VTTNEETIGTPDNSGEEKNSGEASTGAATPGDAVATLSAERDQVRDQLLRTAAEFDNYRKRTRRDIDDARQRGKEDAVKDILPVFDNLERAVQAAESAQSIASVVEGVKMVLKLFDDTAERMGLTRVKSVGERFDPQVHEAIQQVETDQQQPGTILTEIVPGYQFGQRLLRAAMVVVARKPSAKPAGDAANTNVNGGAPASGTGSTNGSDSGHNA
jgi:molecular chaperone GrpE